MAQKSRAGGERIISSLQLWEEFFLSGATVLATKLSGTN